MDFNFINGKMYTLHENKVYRNTEFLVELDISKGQNAWNAFMMSENERQIIYKSDEDWALSLYDLDTGITEKLFDTCSRFLVYKHWLIITHSNIEVSTGVRKPMFQLMDLLSHKIVFEYWPEQVYVDWEYETIALSVENEQVMFNDSQGARVLIFNLSDFQSQKIYLEDFIDHNNFMLRGATKAGNTLKLFIGKVLDKELFSSEMLGIYDYNITTKELIIVEEYPASRPLLEGQSDGTLLCVLNNTIENPSYTRFFPSTNQMMEIPYDWLPT